MAGGGKVKRCMPRISLLSRKEKERIHGKSLDLLQKIGIQFNNKRALKILEAAGCGVNWDNLSATIPSKLVEKALATLPSRFLKAGHDPAKDFIVGDGSLSFVSPGQSTFILDLETNQKRLSTLDDLVETTKLIDAMDEITEFVPLVLPNDVPPPMRMLRAARTVLSLVRKHTVGAVEEEGVTPFLLEMFDAVLGDRARLRERPVYTAIINPSEPFQNGRALVDSILDLAPYQPPIMMQFMTLAGATAPMTEAGNILQENANFLGNMTLYQTAAPGWPIEWSLGTGLIDMKVGRYTAGPENVLSTLALIEMAKFYHVPVATFSSSACDAFISDSFRNGTDYTMCMLMNILAGVDLMWWPGELDGMNMVDLRGMIIGKYAADKLLRIRKGMILDEDHFMADTMVKMGFAGNYLAEPSTKKYYHAEWIKSDLFPPASWESWKESGKNVDDIVKERVAGLLAKYEPPHIAPEVIRELDRIIAAAEKARLA
jgi:trimethylamine--corrinoid protein Co-methyltransferase